MSELSLPYCIESASSKSATLPRRHRRQLSNDSTYVTSREHSPSLRYRSSSHASSTLPRNTNNVRSPLNQNNKSRESSRKTSRSSLATKANSSPVEINPTTKNTIRITKDETKVSSVESLKTSHTNNLDEKSEYESCNDKNNEIEQSDNNLKSLINIDNSGPSSIESHKSSKTGSSLTSGPSSLESHKTVIARTPTVNDKNKRSPKRRDSLKQRAKISPLNLSSSNSFTLQVTTNQNGNSFSAGNASATINSGTGTKIYVQNSPVRSVITFENGQNNDPNPNLVIINGTTSTPTTTTTEKTQTKNTNNQQIRDGTLNNNSKDTISNDTTIKQETMNNSRKLSLQMPQRDSLNYKNVIKNVPFNSNSTPDSPITNSYRDFTKNSFESNPPSPTKTYDNFGGSASNVYTKNLTDSITSLDKSYNSILDFSNKLVEKNILGSEPNISSKDSDKTPQIKDQFPSLSDLSFNFTSLAAQKILKGVSINSIDTLVELNMAANGEKQNNCDIVHTDFGLV